MITCRSSTVAPQNGHDPRTILRGSDAIHPKFQRIIANTILTLQFGHNPICGPSQQISLGSNAW